VSDLTRCIGSTDLDPLYRYLPTARTGQRVSCDMGCMVFRHIRRVALTWGRCCLELCCAVQSRTIQGICAQSPYSTYTLAMRHPSTYPQVRCYDTFVSVSGWYRTSAIYPVIAPSFQCKSRLSWPCMYMYECAEYRYRVMQGTPVL
jgi:hypothetical protein